MTDSPGHTDDPKTEVAQAVYDRLTSYEESATPEQIRTELDEALDQAGLDLDEDVRQRLVAHISDRGGADDVAGVL